jgi:hypothetical protein
MVNGHEPDVASRVAAVQLVDGAIVLTIQLSSFSPGTPVEISGYITQASGAFARFYKVSQVPLPASPDGSADLTVSVPATRLAEDEDITVIARVAEVWSTVLGRDVPEPSAEPWAASPPEDTRGVSPPARTGATWRFKRANRLGQLPPAQWGE